MVYKSINDLASTYLTEMFSRLSDTCKRGLRNTRSDLEIPMQNLQMAKNASHIKARQCGIVSASNQNCHRF